VLIKVIPETRRVLIKVIPETRRALIKVIPETRRAHYLRFDNSYTYSLI